MFNICIIIIHNKKRGLKLNLTIYDLWTYFRMGFATYTSKPISVLNMILLLVISVSNDLSIFLIILISLAVIIISIFFGYLHYKRSKVYQTDTWINFENNPVQVAYLVNEYYMMIQICHKLNIPIPAHIQEFYEYFNNKKKYYNYDRIKKEE